MIQLYTHNISQDTVAKHLERLTVTNHILRHVASFLMNSPVCFLAGNTAVGDLVAPTAPLQLNVRATGPFLAQTTLVRIVSLDAGWSDLHQPIT